MACPLVGTKPLSPPVLEYCLQEQTSVIYANQKQYGLEIVISTCFANGLLRSTAIDLLEKKAIFQTTIFKCTFFNEDVKISINFHWSLFQGSI